MRPTLFTIPQELFGWPMFGWGLALAVWCLFSVGLIMVLVRRQGWSRDTLSYLPLLLLVGAAFVFLLPLVEEPGTAAEPGGLKIRGYGLMMLVGMVLGVLLAMNEARREGINPELMISFSFWVLIWGIVGARAFYVIQKWDEGLFSEPGKPWYTQVFNFTEGGLVVYGSFIGGALAGVWMIRKYRWNALRIADLISASVMIGLALGRLGCLLNGCCWGGLCADDAPFCLRFPAGRLPYVQQLTDGRLLGLQLKLDDQGRPLEVLQVLPQATGPATQLKAGDRFQPEVPALGFQYAVWDVRRAEGLPVIALDTVDGRSITWLPHQLPRESLPLEPAQIYSSINALLLCFLLWSLYPFRRRDGQVAATLVTIYPLTRILLEFVRSDEAGIWGTSLTISQWVSLAVVAASVLLWIYVQRQPSLSRPTPPNA